MNTLNVFAVSLVYCPSETPQLICRKSSCALGTKCLIALEVAHRSWNDMCGNAFQFQA